MSTKFLRFAMIGTMLLTFAACKKDSTTVNNPVYNLKGNASGAQEAPTRNNSTATGTLSGTYNKDDNMLNYTITWNGLTGGNPTAMHFHGPADPGVAASVVIPITGFTSTASGTFTNSAKLTDAQETDLMNGLWYYNIHNATYPMGEIRGQVVLTQ